MQKKEANLKWFPIWVEKWLWGSTRLELTIEERAVWIDLLAIASKDGGHIRANEGYPYPPEQLAGMLRIPVELLNHAIERCLETGKLRKDNDGSLYVVNWDEYQFSDRYLRKLKKTKHNITLHNRGSKKPEPCSDKPELLFVFTTRSWGKIPDEDMKTWQESFPACDINAELKKMSSWLVANPKQKKSNYRRFIHNWLTRAQDRGGTRQTTQPKDDSSLAWAKKRMAEKQHD